MPLTFSPPSCRLPGRPQVREDIKNGVFVENLSEEAVFSVEDVVRLLARGAGAPSVWGGSMPASFVCGEQR